jgi:hypothetical protein
MHEVPLQLQKQQNHRPQAAPAPAATHHAQPTAPTDLNQPAKPQVKEKITKRINDPSQDQLAQLGLDWR